MAKTYTAPHRVYVGSRLYKPGEPFTTDAVKGEQWIEQAGDAPKPKPDPKPQSTPKPKA